MWRFQLLYERLRKDTRFETVIVVYPFPGAPEVQDKDMAELLDFFSRKGIPVLNLHKRPNPGKCLREVVNPDLIFYSQQYNNLYGNDLDNKFFLDKLIAYIPYAMVVFQEAWLDRNTLNEIAWRMFFPSESMKQQAIKIQYNKGYNIRVTGDPMLDFFKSPMEKTTWKKQVLTKKKIIWAPHFSLQKDSLLHHNSFSWLHNLMLEIADYYKDQLQFSFKPHPRLLKSLYEMPDWGKEKADAYFQAWDEGENTQLDTGLYIDLFKGSDAMIHDCGSFTAEYLLTGNPVLFTTKDFEAVFAQLNQMGQEAIQAHYISDSKTQIINFIEKIVLEGQDPLKEKRDAFYKKYLCLPSGKSVAENIYNEIVFGLGWEASRKTT